MDAGGTVLPPRRRPLERNGIVIEVAQLDLQKAVAKKSVRQVAGAARNFAGGLRQRMNAIAAEDAVRLDAGKDERGGRGFTNRTRDTTNDSEVMSGPSVPRPTCRSTARRPITRTEPSPKEGQ